MSFDHTFVYSDTTVRARHGKVWTPAETQSLRKELRLGATLKQICESLERPAVGVLTKAVSHSYLERDIEADKYYYTDLTLSSPEHLDKTADADLESPEYFINPINEKGTEMSSIEIKHVTLINGVDITKLSDDQIFDTIAKLEQSIESLDRLKHRPKALERRIESLKTQIKTLVDFSDSRDAAID